MNFASLFKRETEGETIPDFIMLGEERAYITKITYTKYKAVESVLSYVPALLIQMALTSTEDFIQDSYTWFSASMDEIYQATAILSGLDANYLKDNAGVDEVVAYVVATSKKNNFAEIVKNVKSLLPKETKQPEKATQ